MEQYVVKLKEHHLKATPQRTAIAEALDKYGHLSIDNLYTLLHKRFSSLSLATIYKNINIMLQNSLVTEVKLPGHKSVYELTKESHAHLQCNKCNKVEDITLNMECILSQAKQKSNFTVKTSSLILSGLCENCR